MAAEITAMAYKKVKKLNALQRRTTTRLKGIKRGPRTVEMSIVAERRKAVAELSAQGMLIADIASALGCSFEVVAQDRHRLRKAQAEADRAVEA